ncbi:hypothetical protein ILUMI_03622 [Ignelater luminosus]|uniref:Uncharacterized protein n=1 Tax=Ignelater luminosus TaxID=2038154 RepID=A0A8K0GFC1_IGNLU|nr:hypothetical protein ILUMI_03622 [Ignelater luminosus]
MGNILLQGTRIVIPESLRQLVVKLDHEGHPGMVRMKGTQVEVMSPEGVCYKRNTSKLKKYYGNNDDIPVTQASEKTHHEDVQVEHDSIRRESSMEPKEEGNEEERSLLSARSLARLRSHPSRTRQPPKWLLDYDQH